MLRGLRISPMLWIYRLSPASMIRSVRFMCASKADIVDELKKDYQEALTKCEERTLENGNIPEM